MKHEYWNDPRWVAELSLVHETPDSYDGRDEWDEALWNEIYGEDAVDDED